MSTSRTELIINKNYEELMHLAAQIHGHYCPGLAKGVMAAVYAMKELKVETDGMEDVLAIVETNNCFSDGVQFTTGCTFGNNSLIFKDFGKTAFTLAKRNGTGIRVKQSAQASIISRESFPDYQALFEKVIVEKNRSEELLNAYKKAAYERSLGMLNLNLHDLFDISHVKVYIPEYAKIVKSVECAVCLESTMINRTKENASGQAVCFECGKSNYNMLDGNGIRVVKM